MTITDADTTMATASAAITPDAATSSPPEKNAIDTGRTVDTRIAMIGNVDSGKSTLIGVLTGGELDNGRGLARQRIFRHSHESSNGRTSCVAQHIMGFTPEHAPVHQPTPHGSKNKHLNPEQKTQAWKAVVEGSSSLMTFIDLAGHERYLKTTIAGLTGCFPDYAAIIIGGNMGVSKMTKEHIGVALALKIPVFVVVTKTDMAPEKVLKHTLKQLTRVLKMPMAQKLPVVMRSDDQIATVVKGGLSRVTPIFLVSNTTGQGLDRLNRFLGVLKPDPAKWERNGAVMDAGSHGGELEIDETFHVRGVGVVVSGTVIRGTIVPNTPLLLGPFNSEHEPWRKVVVRSVHIKRVEVADATAGESCSVALRLPRKGLGLERSHIHRGMVLIDASLQPVPVMEFEAELLVLHHPTTIKRRYQPVIHCGNVRQTAAIVWMSQEALRSGDRARVRMRFVCRPEFMHVGRTLIAREGSTKCIGRVLKIRDLDELPP